jgi:response regulator RpfG family c-di-GMP phosphodiesterase
MAIFSTKNLKPKKIDTKAHTVLLVDDEEANLHVMSSLLDKTCHVMTALNGRLALEVIKQMDGKELCMIISDQRMPEMTGVELLERTVESHPDTIRLIVSGYSDISDVLVAINKAKIYHFITKPFEPEEFMETVGKALKTYDYKKQMTQQFDRMQAQLCDYESSQLVKDKQLEKALKKLKSLGENLD